MFKMTDVCLYYKNGNRSQYFFHAEDFDGIVRLCKESDNLENYMVAVVDSGKFKVVNRENGGERIYEDVVMARKMVEGIECYQFVDEHLEEASFPVSEWKCYELTWKEV